MIWWIRGIRQLQIPASEPPGMKWVLNNIYVQLYIAHDPCCHTDNDRDCG